MSDKSLNHPLAGVSSGEAGGRVSRTNPLPCGCGAVGTPDMDTLGTKMEYRNIHVRHCPLHAAATELYQALMAAYEQFSDPHSYPSVPRFWLEKAEAALAKARGEASSASTAAPLDFDYTDGLNRYRPCPRCQSDHEMGLAWKNEALAVECHNCGFRGPAIKGSPSSRHDKWAFDAWNDLPREAERVANAESRLAAIRKAAEPIRVWLETESSTYPDVEKLMIAGSQAVKNVRDLVSLIDATPPDPPAGKTPE